MAALLRALKAQRQGQAGESESVEALQESSLQAQSSPAQQALQMAVPPQLVEPEPSVQRPLAPPLQPALPLVQQESRALPA